jgi:hypothetical protein
LPATTLADAPECLAHFRGSERFAGAKYPDAALLLERRGDSSGTQGYLFTLHHQIERVAGGETQLISESLR